jgi:hypothetical protein
LTGKPVAPGSSGTVQQNRNSYRPSLTQVASRSEVSAASISHSPIPPTGAKGLNLAISDVRVLAEVLEQAIRNKEPDALDEYGPRALARAWRAQHFSYWMTTMLHHLPNAAPFDTRRQIGELKSVVNSVAGSTYLAEAYTGWPGQR